MKKANLVLVLAIILSSTIFVNIAQAILPITVKYHDFGGEEDIDPRDCYARDATVYVYTTDPQPPGYITCAAPTNRYGMITCSDEELPFCQYPRWTYWIKIYTNDGVQRDYLPGNYFYNNSSGTCYGSVTSILWSTSCQAYEHKPCVDYYCCSIDNTTHSSGCNDTCEACNVASHEGTCTFIPSGQDPKGNCSSKNITGIATCNDASDNNPYTWDYRPAFTSTCNGLGGGLGNCTNGNSTITHTCSVASCGAECDQSTSYTLTGSTCKYNCNSDSSSCLFQSSCSINSFCSGNIRNYNGGCSASGCSFSTEDCSTHNGCYAYGSGCEDRSYSCAPSSCTYSSSNQNTDYLDSFVNYCSGAQIRKNQTLHDFGCDGTCKDHTSQVNDSLVQDCSLQNNWYNTSTYQWVSTGQCTQKQQVWQEYRTYTCSAATCSYTVTSNRWSDTGVTGNKNDGTACDDGLYCTVSDVCASGVCSGTARDCSLNNLVGIATCDNIPDNYHPTWDYRAAFASTCNEISDICTTGDPTITHTCSVSSCSAECDATHSCSDKCVGTVREYSGSCDSQNTCTCSYSTEDCTSHNGWYNTTNTQWISIGDCAQKQQRQQEYRTYTCSAASCTYTVTGNQWVDTGSTSYNSSSTVCRASAGACDPAEYCTGSSATCPSDLKSPSGTVCRPAASQCDQQEVCDGTNAACPADSFKPAGTSCDDGLFCTVNDTCNVLGSCISGSSRNCTDSFSCTDDSCDEVHDTCVNAPNNAKCSSPQICNPSIFSPPTGCGYSSSMTITIISPKASNYTKTSVPLTYSIDRPVVWTAYSLNNGQNVSLTSNTTISSGLVNGNNNLLVYARDSNNNSGSSSVVFNYCKGDTNGDRHVNVLDLIVVAGKLGTNNPIADANGDGTVNVLDLIVVASNLNAVC